MYALDGIRVLDLTHIVSGPFATMLLADLGAEVIKIERPGTGEATRRLLADDPAHSLHGMGAYFLALNRNKQSVTIDLHDPCGQELLRELAARSDVVIYNYRYGVAERLGISHKTLAEDCPHIITCSITGFGEVGPDRALTSFDMVAQATGGGMSITGEPDSPPLRAGLPVGDLSAAMAAVIGILAALHERQRTNIGQHVDISMQDVQISQLSYLATMFSLAGTVARSTGNSHLVHVPYNAYQTQDGSWMTLTVVGDEIWTRLMSALECPDLDTEDHRQQAGRARNRAAIDRRLTELFATAPRAHWLALLGSARVPCAPVNDIGAVCRDPHVAARAMMLDLEHSQGGRFQAPGNPVKLSAAGPQRLGAPPRLGEHTEQVLARVLGKSAADIRDLRARSVI